MIEYNYIAKNKDGDIQKGVVEAESKISAAKVLTARDLFPITIILKGKGGFGLGFLNRVGRKDKVFLIRQLATAINAGLPITQSLNVLGSQTSKKSLKEMINQLSRDVEGGMSLAASFARFPKVFSQIDLTLIETGEATGTLDKTLKRLADNIENDYKIIKKIRSAMVYPVFVLVVAVVVLIAMSVYVLPQMKGLYASFGGAKLPLLTRLLLGVSYAMTHYSLIILIVLVALVFILRAFIKTKKGRYMMDTIKISIPAVKKLIIAIYLSRFSRTMATLVGSGVSILDSLSIVSRAVNNVLYENSIKEAAMQVKGGKPLSEPLSKSELFPPIVTQMISVGEQTGEMDQMLTNLADYYDDEVDNMVKSLTSIVEPVLIVFVGGMIGLMLIGVMLPIYSIGKIL
jgi:type IV pilus assembly protein PilC